MKANQSLALFLIMFLSANMAFAKGEQDVNVINAPDVNVISMPSNTHLGVTSNNLVTLNTGSIPNDNSAYPFKFDMANSYPMGNVPANHSLVVTDIIVEPTTFSTTDHYEVLIGVDGLFGRSFSTRHIGSDTKHYSFTGGFVVPAGTTLMARNYSTSAAAVFVTVYGYLTTGSGQPVYQPLF